MNGPVPRLAWSAPQRGVLLVLLGCLLVYLIIRFAMHPVYISEPQPLIPARYEELSGGIDPNTADAATLAALPVIGPKRAQAIVDYREAYQRDHPGKVAFTHLDDLTRVKGIGQATVEQVRPYLILPGADRPGPEP